ncbi:hypothetical protein SAMN04487904_11137 [Actinopolyspora lacussalsi subsp. righensis]|uniref:Uncharacterized protein n=1 Tax=Actinopolyspora righensis TaxID=995060 RepID=A0A1I7BGD4_9ACTN|nr:hypothetical protein [Actinopolyspora righensis]SFT86245.1 hypothetical protein SAMN04487904_11137 [Actinopolyspora righensis]
MRVSESLDDTERPAPHPRFVTGKDSWTIHATAPYKGEASAKAGRGKVACFCGETIELAPHPPERVVGNRHHYCPVCFQHLIAGSDRPPSPLNSYESWLLELASLEAPSPTASTSEWFIVPCRQQRHGRAELRLKPTAQGIAILAPAPAVASLLSLAEARQLRDALDGAIATRETEDESCSCPS